MSRMSEKRAVSLQQSYDQAKRREMRAYIVVCGLIFAFVAVAHALELRGGGMWHLREADFVNSTLAVLGMLGWSIALLIRRSK